MKKFTIYFEIFGKKMKHSVVAENYDQAKQIIKDKIVFHKVDIEPTFNTEDFLMGFFKKK